MNKSAIVVFSFTLYSIVGLSQISETLKNTTVSFSLGMGYGTRTIKGFNSLDNLSIIDPVAVTYIPKQRFHLYMPLASFSISNKIYKGFSIGIANYFGGFNQKYQINIPSSLDFSIPHHRQFVNELEYRVIDFNSRLFVEYLFGNRLSLSAGYSFYRFENTKSKQTFLIDNSVRYDNFRRRYGLRDSKNNLFFTMSYKINTTYFVSTSYDFNLSFAFFSIGASLGAPSPKHKNRNRRRSSGRR
jgi:hypothetical protein